MSFRVLDSKDFFETNGYVVWTYPYSVQRISGRKFFYLQWMSSQHFRRDTVLLWTSLRIFQGGSSRFLSRMIRRKIDNILVGIYKPLGVALKSKQMGYKLSWMNEYHLKNETNC